MPPDGHVLVLHADMGVEQLEHMREQSQMFVFFRDQIVRGASRTRTRAAPSARNRHVCGAQSSSILAARPIRHRAHIAMMPRSSNPAEGAHQPVSASDAVRPASDLGGRWLLSPSSQPECPAAAGGPVPRLVVSPLIAGAVGRGLRGGAEYALRRVPEDALTTADGRRAVVDVYLLPLGGGMMWEEATAWVCAEGDGVGSHVPLAGTAKVRDAPRPPICDICSPLSGLHLPPCKMLRRPALDWPRPFEGGLGV